MPTLRNNGIDGQMNWSSITTNKPNQSSQDTTLIGIYGKVEFSSAIILAILCPITVFTNGLFLLALYKDTPKCFRKTPSTFFVAGLSLADFITGLLVEPSFALHYILHYLNYTSDILRVTQLIFTIGGTISTIAISISFFIVLAMSLSQYIAIRYPHRYKTIVTSKRVLRLLGLSGLYFLAFSMLRFTGISLKTFFLLDVILHPTLISLLLIVVLILIRKAFKERVTGPSEKRSSQTLNSSIRTQDNFEINFSRECNSLKSSYTQRNSLLSPSLETQSQKCVEIELTAVEELNESCDEGKASQFKFEGSRTSRESHVKHIQSVRKIIFQDVKEDGRNEMVDNSVTLNECKNVKQNKNENGEQKAAELAKEQFCSSRFKKIKTSYRETPRKRVTIEKQFTIISFYLSAILLVSSLSHTIVFFVFLLKMPETLREDVYINIALRITDLMLFVKVCLDAFIYAWRLPPYRRSLIRTISCGRLEPVTVA